MARARTGQLILRASGYYARVWAVVDGERVRVCKALGTHNKAAARRKLQRLLETDDPQAEDVKRPETFAEAAERVYEARRTSSASPKAANEELASLKLYAVPLIGHMACTLVQPKDVNDVLDACKAKGRSRQTCQHIKQRISNVFAQLRREGVIKVNPCDDAEVPKYAETVIKERAVLTDAELVLYLAWVPEQEHRQAAVRERQTMACMSRMFGGLRTGDLHALRWESFDVEHGGFEWGYAPRQKTRRPQLLEVPEMLRPFLHDWWQRAGRPVEGLVFPVRRVGKRGDRVGQQRLGVSHAEAFKRDLKRAFEYANKVNPNTAPVEGSRRWRELFDETEYTRSVDFHSWRRAFAQALGDADVNAQQAAALTGHASLAAHARYLRNSGKMRQVPTAALPDVRLLASPSDAPEQRALAKGRHDETPLIITAQAPSSAHENASDVHACESLALTSKPRVAGLSPAGDALF